MEGRQETLADKDLETVQSKIRDVLGPICRLWTIIEKAATQENSEEKEDQVSLEDIIRLIEKSFMLLGQANNKVLYFRRLNTLNVLLNSKSDEIKYLCLTVIDKQYRTFWSPILETSAR